VFSDIIDLRISNKMLRGYFLVSKLL